MFLKEFCFFLVLINSSIAAPTVAVDPANPPLVLPQPQLQSRTFSTLGSWFGSGYNSGYRYPDSNRGYPSYGVGYTGSVYGGNPVGPQPVVPGYTGGYGGYGGYGWRGSSDNRGYGWANRGQSGWSQNYGR